MHPLRRGFDEFFGFLGAGHMFFPEDLTDPGLGKLNNTSESWHYWIMRNHEPVQLTNYLTDAFSDEAVSFVARHKDQPFLLFLSYNAPHSPMEAPDNYLKRFTQIPGVRRRTCAAMISAVDDGVGRLLAELRQDGLTSQTVVTFLSASGGGLDANCSDNYPLRGSRDTVYEGGWRVPFVMQWPGHLPAGRVYDPPVLSLDLFATFATLAQAPLNPHHPLDGVNLIPYLTATNSDVPHTQCFVRMPDRDAFALRSGDYKFVIPGRNRPPELYDLTTDISECRNLATSQPEVLKRLQAESSAWNEQMVSPAPSAPAFHPAPQPIDTETGK
jgi:arylsulfatase A-like enzyme